MASCLCRRQGCTGTIYRPSWNPLGSDLLASAARLAAGWGVGQVARIWPARSLMRARRLIVRAIPTGANHKDVTQLPPLIDPIPPVLGTRGGRVAIPKSSTPTDASIPLRIAPPSRLRHQADNRKAPHRTRKRLRKMPLGRRMNSLAASWFPSSSHSLQTSR